MNTFPPPPPPHATACLKGQCWGQFYFRYYCSDLLHHVRSKKCSWSTTHFLVVNKTLYRVKWSVPNPSFLYNKNFLRSEIASSFITRSKSFFCLKRSVTIIIDYFSLYILLALNSPTVIENHVEIFSHLYSQKLLFPLLNFTLVTDFNLIYLQVKISSGQSIKTLTVTNFSNASLIIVVCLFTC